MANDHLDPLPDDVAELLAAERSAPGIPDVARARLSRRLADSPPSSFPISEDAADALRAGAARRHSTTMLMAVAGLALVVGVGAGLAAGGLGNDELPSKAAAARAQATPPSPPAPVTEPAPAPPLPPRPTPAVASPAPVPAPVAKTPAPAAPKTDRSIAAATKAAATPPPPAPTSAPSMTPPPEPATAKGTPPPPAVDDEPKGTVIPLAAHVANLGKPPAATGGDNLYIDLARDAVRNDDATTAIALVKAHRKKFSRSHNSEERDMLWIQALIIKRKYKAARDRIDRFQRRYPRSTHLRALREQLAEFPPDRLPSIRITPLP